METLDKHFREITKAVFKRYGFAHAELLRRWPEIVGEELSRWCEPERIKWPRASSEQTQKMGGTLVIRAAPGRGLELQHEAPLILERVNRYYGYCAVGKVQVVQGSTNPRTRVAPPAKPASQPVRPLAGIDDANLRAALERLGSHIAPAAVSSPQAKE